MTFPAADEDYFQAMDGGVALTPDEVKGRNMWLVWTGGNDRLWDKLTNLTFGAFDLLKILSSSPGLKYSRDNRWNYLGLVNEPCFTKATGAEPAALWAVARCARARTARPIHSKTRQNIPGVAVGARGKNIPARILLRIPERGRRAAAFPQPGTSIKLRQSAWNAERFYSDPDYYSVEGSGPAIPRRDVLRVLSRRAEPGKTAGQRRGPAVGKSRAAPSARNISGSTASCAWNADHSTFLFQLLHTARPGSLDTSLVSSDNINNPRTMNAVYNLWPRLEAAKRWGQETLGPTNLANKQFNDFVSQGPLTQFFQPPNTVWTPHVLKDGCRFGRRARRAQPRLCEYRPLQRGVAAPFQPGARRQAGHPDRDHDGAQELVLLAGDRDADPSIWRCSWSKRPIRTS